MQGLLEFSKTSRDPEVELSAEAFLQSLTKAPQSALLLDFDGTLAPFDSDPLSVHPWPGVLELLQQIQDSKRTRLAVVTGRPAQEVRQLLPLRAPLDIWGLHGAEHLHPDGGLDREPLPPQDAQALTQARAFLQSIELPPGIRIEEKWNAIVLHWRGVSKRQSQAATEFGEKVLLPFAGNSGLQLLPFDGGMELRSGHNKGEAVRMILKDLPDNAPVAYLGDDVTDENAFQVLSDRGLCVLVRPRFRPTAAHVWLRAPAQLCRFLATWLTALRS